MPRLTKAERRKRSEQSTKSSKKSSKKYFDSIDDLNSAYLGSDGQESHEVNDSTTNATLSQAGHASDSHTSSQPETMAAQTASTLKSRRSRHKATVTEPTTSTSTASSSNMSKSQLKKLAKLEEKKQKDARREALYESLQKNALNKDQMTLMKRSGTIGQRDTLKQRLHQAVQFSKMGIQKNEDRLVVERPRQTTTRNKKKIVCGENDQSSKELNDDEHPQDGSMDAFHSTQANQRNYTNTSAFSVANQQISMTTTDTTQTTNSNMKLNENKTENDTSTDSTEKSFKSSCLSGSDTLTNPASIDSIRSTNNGVSLLNNEQFDSHTQDKTQSDSVRQTRKKENQSDSDVQAQSALTKLQALRQKNQRLAQDGKFAIDPAWINLEKARPQFQQSLETETSISQQSNSFSFSLQLGATQRKTNNSTMKEQTKVEDTDQLGAHVADSTQPKNDGTHTVLNAKQINQLNDLKSSKTSMTSPSQPHSRNEISHSTEASMSSSSQAQLHNKTSHSTETSMDPKKKSTISSSSPRILVRRDHRIQENRMKLPVCQMEQEIMEMIHDNDVVILCGETGSGKTTQVPQFLYEAGYSSTNYPGLIGVTQPRRVAAVAMAQRVGTELGFPLDTKKGSVVGYQVRYDTNHSGSKTAIKFMTDGILMREIQTDLLLRKYSVIILDEAHERNINTDILIGLLSRAVPMRNEMARSKEEMSKSPKDRLYPLKLIIMSATLRVEDFTGNKKLFPIAPPVVHVRARQFPVTIHFSRRTELNNYLAEVERKVVKIHQKLPEGGILVFLTSQQEIEVLCARLRNRFNRKKRRRERSINHNNGLDHTTIDDLLSSSERSITQQTSTNDASTSLTSMKYTAAASSSRMNDSSMLSMKDTTAASSRMNDASMSSSSGLHNTSKRNDAARANQMGQTNDKKRQKIQDKQSTAGVSSMTGENVVPNDASQNDPQTPQNYPHESLNVQDNTDLNKQETEQTQTEDQEPTPVHVLPLYAMLPRAQQLKVFQTPPKNHRFIVVATNVAETSVTIPNIRYVVDSGRVKRRVYQSKSGISRYEVGWISQASANQRAGRAGRTQAGHCYRLYSSAVFSDQFNQFEPPEIESMPIESVVLQLKSIGVQHVIQFPFPSPPPITSLQNAIRSLTYLGALKPIFTSNNPTHSMTAAVLHHINTNLENTNLSAAISSSDDIESATEHLAMVQYLTSNTIDQIDTQSTNILEESNMDDTDIAKTNKISFLPKAEYEILTPLGHAISRIPVTSHLAKFLLLTTENHIDLRNKVSETSLRLLDLAITIVASITVRNMFVTPQIPRRLKQQSKETSKQTTVGQEDNDEKDDDNIDDTTANASDDDIDDTAKMTSTAGKNDEETRMTNETELNEYQRQRELAKQAHAQLLDPTSDIFSLLRVIGSVMYSICTSSSGSNGQTMKQYCQKTFLHYKSVKEALQLRQQLWRVIAHSLFDKEETWTGSSDTAELDTTDTKQSNLSNHEATGNIKTTKTKQSNISKHHKTETETDSTTSTSSINQFNRTRFSQALDSTITPPTRQESNILLQYLTASSLGRIARRASPNTMYSLLEQAGIRISPKSNGSSIPYIPSDPQFGPIVFVHPSSSVCTSKASDMPEWISFEEIITTSRPYAKFVTVIHPDWLVNASAGTNLCWFSPPLDIPTPYYNSTKDQVMAMFVPYFGPRSWRLTPIEQPFIPNHTKTYHQIAGIFGYALLSGHVIDGFEYLKQQYLIPPALLTRGGHQPCVVSLQNELQKAKIFSRKELIARWRDDSTFLHSAIRLWLPKSIRTKFNSIWHDQIVLKALEMNKNI